MIVAFPFAFGGKEEPEHVGRAKVFLRMMRMFSPRSHIVQMADRDTVGIDGVDGCVRTDNDELGQWHFKAMLEFPYEQFLRIDYDVVLRADVSEVFEHDFDIAIAKEHNSLMNNGVVFVKNREFFREASAEYRNTTIDSWNDIQNAMQFAIDGGKFRVRKLDPSVYNWIYKIGTKNPDAKILHFKGARKEYMTQYCIPECV